MKKILLFLILTIFIFNTLYAENPDENWWQLVPLNEKYCLLRGWYCGIFYCRNEITNFTYDIVPKEYSDKIIDCYDNILNTFSEQSLDYWISMINSFYLQRGNTNKSFQEALFSVINQYLKTKE